MIISELEYIMSFVFIVISHLSFKMYNCLFATNNVLIFLKWERLILLASTGYSFSVFGNDDCDEHNSIWYVRIFLSHAWFCVLRLKTNLYNLKTHYQLNNKYKKYQSSSYLIWIFLLELIRSGLYACASIPPFPSNSIPHRVDWFLH